MFVNEILGLIYGNGIRKEIEYQQTYRYLSRYKNKEYWKNDISRTDVKENRTIWICWLQGLEYAPALVKKCYESVIKNKPEEYEVIVITEYNMRKYIELPDFIWKKYENGIISKTHFSDILRIQLLYTYGGCWIDSTVYISGKIPAYIWDSNLFLFKWSLLDNSVLQMSSWWITAAKGQKIISDVRDVLFSYWKRENRLRDYFLLHIIFSKIINEDSFNLATFRNIPYVCNSVAHILSRKMEFEFDEEEWERIKSMSVIHKLSNKRNYLKGDIFNFYTALLEDKLV